MKDLNNIYYFVSIVEHGGVSAASEALRISKSVLSQHLAKLEGELGVCLIHRTTRRLQITDIGRRYYERCRAALTELDRGREVIDDIREVPRGKVRLTSPLNFAQVMLSPVLASFMAKYPEVEVTLDITNEDVDLIASRYDLALRIVPSIPVSNMVSRSFALSEHVLVSAPSLLEQHGTPATPEDLKAFPTVAGALPAEPGGRYVWHLTGPAGASQAIQHHPRLVTPDISVLRDATLVGCGVAGLPLFWCRDALAEGRLVQVLPDWTLPFVKLHALYPSRRGLTLAVRTFIDHFSSQLVPWIESAVNGNGTVQERRQPKAAKQDGALYCAEDERVCHSTPSR